MERKQRLCGRSGAGVDWLAPHGKPDIDVTTDCALALQDTDDIRNLPRLLGEEALILSAKSGECVNPLQGGNARRLQRIQGLSAEGRL